MALASGALARRKAYEANELEKLRLHLVKRRREMREPFDVPEHELLMTPLMAEWSGFWVRRPEDWVCRTRSQDLGRRSADLVRHLFEVYPVPVFLSKLWSNTKQWPGDLGAMARTLGASNRDKPGSANYWFKPHHEAARYISWYVAAATGMSVYKDCAAGVLSRQETHAFLGAPDEFLPSQNIWWARAKVAGLSLGTVNNVARSKICRTNDAQRPFWMSAARFFGHMDVGLHEMDDLTDFLGARLEIQPAYSLKGRTLESVREASAQWHRLQAKMRDHGNATWEGSPLPDWEWRHGNVEDRTLVIWRIRQLRTGRELVAEGHAQHHCVASYKASCINGNTSIWSMTREGMVSDVGGKRTLTLEVRNEEVVQARGYANRLPRPDEKDMLRRWGADTGVGLRAYY